MQDPTCAIDGCEKPIRARGWCAKHHTRYLRHGDPLGAAQRPTLWERIESKIIETDSCWRWTGAHGANGYASLRVGRSGPESTGVLVHREVFKHYRGPIPDGKLVDHVCRNRWCVNPAHLRLATNKQNMENVSRPQSNNTSGFTGAFRNGNRWAARVIHNGRRYWGGCYDTAAEAGEAALELRLKLFTHNDHDRGGPHEPERARCDA